MILLGSAAKFIALSSVARGMHGTSASIRCPQEKEALDAGRLLRKRLWIGEFSADAPDRPAYHECL